MGDDTDTEIIHRTLDRSESEPTAQIAEIVASLEGKSQNDVKPAYTQIDDVLAEIFNDPPVPEAQVEISFSYEGYRITVEQNGQASFVKVS